MYCYQILFFFNLRNIYFVFEQFLPLSMKSLLLFYLKSGMRCQRNIFTNQRKQIEIQKNSIKNQ